jgi:flagellar biosynthesis protein FlhB
MADAQRTEKPTKRRLEKARREGKFPASREMIAAAQFLAFVVLLGACSPILLDRIRRLTRVLLQIAFRPVLTVRGIEGFYREALLHVFTPVLLAGAAFAGIALAAQLAATKLGISLHRLAPDITKLNPFPKLRELPAQNFVSSMQALLLFPVLGLAVYAIARENITRYLSLPFLAVGPALKIVSGSYMSLLWRAAFGFGVLGCLDLVRQQRRYTNSLRMSKQEIREELKESDGDPLIKSRIRRLQRDVARRNMLKEVPQASAVIVNPTHYSVAIRYELEAMAAPRVVAKGKNYLAFRIRQIATEHQVPIIENQPLAQALYKSADVGQEIPPHLYRAVAEILAYIFKLMHQRRA